MLLEELIGTATANKNGLMSKIFAVTDIERGKGLIIDYKADSNGLYTSSSLQGPKGRAKWQRMCARPDNQDVGLEAAMHSKSA